MAAAFRSRLAALEWRIDERMPGEFLASACFGKKAMHIVAVGGRECVLDAPNLLQHQISALVGLQFFCRVTHTVLQSVDPACKAREA